MFVEVACLSFAIDHRIELGHFLSMVAGIPLGDVLVKDVQAVNISGNECLTASLWIAGVNGIYECLYNWCST